MDILTIGKRIFVALRNQALFKQDYIIHALNDANDTRFLVAPFRKTWNEHTGKSLRAQFCESVFKQQNGDSLSSML